jgi:hypothetical protein
LHPMYQKLMRNAVRWCLRLDEAGSTPHAELSVTRPAAVVGK